jgi:hypothetical protein
MKIFWNIEHPPVTLEELLRLKRYKNYDLEKIGCLLNYITTYPTDYRITPQASPIPSDKEYEFPELIRRVRWIMENRTNDLDSIPKLPRKPPYNSAFLRYCKRENEIREELCK